MVKKLAMLAGLIAVAVVSVSAQPYNARMQSLGGTFILNDMYDVFRMPGYMNDYKDRIQATFDTNTITGGGASFVGIKSLGALTIGGAFNPAFVMSQGFYTIGAANANLLLPLTSAPLLTANVQRAPHLLIGFDVDVIKFGIDGYWEYSGSSYSSEDVTTGAGATITKADVNRSISNPGMQLGANINTGEVKLAFVAGVGFPTIAGTAKATTDGINTIDSKWLSNGFLTAKAGGEVELPIESVQLRLGAVWNFEMYQFKTEITTYNPATLLYTTAITKMNVTTTNTVSPFIGIKTVLPENLVLGVQDYSVLAFSTTKSDANDNPSTTTTLYHKLSLGLEKSIPTVLFFDSLAVRGGLAMPIATTLTSVKTLPAANQTVITNTGDETTWGPAEAYIGLGASVGILTCDLALNPAAWAVAIGGPQVARFTATVKL